jgi:glyoxylase-like metal-dependent hydrolase (beta-lactamase superfamily II)
MQRFVAVTRDVGFMRCAMVNVAVIGDRSGWLLIDAGLPGYADTIREAAEVRFGTGTRPRAVVLSHGHFDHVGSLERLLDDWDVPVYAHRLELPYLTGRSAYPPPDPLVGRGSMAILSRLYPRGPIDLGGRVQELPPDGVLPGVAGWRWIHTPGHTPGHVSFFSDVDRTLVSADALITTKQESALAVLMQRRELHGPPAYFTSDWDAARDSVRCLAALKPEVLVPGHGRPWAGSDLHDELRALSARFDVVERPRIGRYAKQPAIADQDGVIMLPRDPLPALLVGAGAMLAVAGMVWVTTKARRQA